jgi:peptidoglycan/LPS O-acetylase OafA/YrhL
VFGRKSVNPPAGRIPSLDGLRAVSILFVLVAHLSPPLNLNFPLATFGVHTFFVISGFLITSLLQKEYERNGRISLSAFYRRRCFRIFPAAYVYILLIALLIPACRSSLPYALTYTVSYNVDGVASQFIHLWSLSIEEQFYFVWPLALVLCFRRRAFVAWSVMLLAALFRAVVALRLIHVPATSLHFSPPGAMDSIAAGCLLAIYETKIRDRFGWMSEFPVIAIAVPLTAWVLAEVCFSGIASVIWGIVPLLVACAIFLAIEREDWILNNQVAVGIGTLSYSLYLWQQPFMVEHIFPVPWSLAMIFACALGSYVLVERPAITIGKHFARPEREYCAARVPHSSEPTS